MSLQTNSSQMTDTHFIICTPPYARNSAGIVILHELGKTISNLNYSVTFVFFDPSNSKWFLSTEPSHYAPNMQDRISKSLSQMEVSLQHALNEGIIIYPEIVSGNPLGARRIVRYFLNKDAAITGVITDTRPNDYILAYSCSFHDKPNLTLFKPVHDPCFNTENTRPAIERTLSLTYFGKAKYTEPLPVISGSVLISKSWPQTSHELASLLKSSKYLFTWDHVTSLMIDALYCGTHVVLMKEHVSSKSRLLESKKNDFPHHLGQWVNEDIFLEVDQSYESKRLKLLAAYNEALTLWPANVLLFIEDALRYFRHR